MSYPLLLFVQDLLKDGALVVLRLYLLCFEVNDLSELVHAVRAGKNFAKNLTRQLLKGVLQIFNG